jgi:hypothetical protein
MTGISKGRCHANEIHGMMQWVEECLEVVIQMNSSFHFSEEEEKKHVRIRILSDVPG